MISCVDTNVILDVLTDDPQFGDGSHVLLRAASQAGSLAICEIVYAELAPQFQSKEELDETLEVLGALVVEGGRDVAYLAATKWSLYRASGGTRERILADFLIGAHALLRGDCLLTRDRGFYSSYFPELKLRMT